MTTRRSHTVLISASLAITAFLLSCTPTNNDPTPTPTPNLTQTERLTNLQKQLPQLTDRLSQLEQAGKDTAYPHVRYDALDWFTAQIDQDLTQGGFSTTKQQITELEQILTDLDNELAAIEGGTEPLQAPQYITSPIELSEGAMLATVQWSDGSQQTDWPVNFNGYTTFDLDMDLTTFGWVNAMAVEIGPNSILISQDETDLSEVEHLIDFLDRAADADIMVSLLLSPNYFPEWALELWPDIRKPDLTCNDLHVDEYVSTSVDAQEARDIIDQYLRILIPEIADHPALKSLILTNEPSYYNAIFDPLNPTLYAQWLEEQYGDIDSLSEAHNTQYDSFDQAPIYPETTNDCSPLQEEDLRPQYDYYRFNDQRFSAWHQWMADTIHELAPDMPIHAKPSDYVMDVPFDGVDPILFDSFSQIAGNDSTKYYRFNDDDFYYASNWLQQNRYLDLLRSISHKPLFNSEDHIIEDEETGTIPPDHIRNVLWQAAIHGRSASTVWLWARSLSDEYTGEPIDEFPGIMIRPLDVVEHGRTALDLMRLGREVHALASAPADVAIIYSPTSLLYNSGAEQSPTYSQATDGTYEALNFSGIKIDYITEQQLADGKADQYDVIFATATTHLPQSAAEQLAQYHQSSGQLVFVGMTAELRDQYDNLFDLSFPNANVVTDLDPATLRETFRPILDECPDIRPVILRDTDSQQEPWGIEWLATQYEDQWLLNITNYTKQTIQLTIEGIPQSNRTNLLTGLPAAEPLTITPLQTYLIAAPTE